MESLKILAGDTIDLQEENEGEFTDNDDDAPRSKKQRNEGNGFGGTILGHASIPASSEGEADPPSSAIDEDDSPTKACDMCTFRNPQEAEVCEMCEKALLT